MPRHDDGIVGLVLAGGRSSRMGRDKAMLPWGEGSLLAHMRQLLHAAGVTRVLVSGDYREDSGVADRTPDLGPLGGLASVADTLPDCSLLVVPVDMPRLSPALLRSLSESPARCACFHGHPLPLWLRLNPVSRQAMTRLLAAPPAGRSLRALHAALHGEFLILPAHWSDQLRDADTPEDWQALCAN